MNEYTVRYTKLYKTKNSRGLSLFPEDSTRAIKIERDGVSIILDAQQITLLQSMLDTWNDKPMYDGISVDDGSIQGPYGVEYRLKGAVENDL